MAVVQKILLPLFLALVALLALLGVEAAQKGFALDTDLMALLPESDSNRRVQLADQKLAGEAGKRILLVVAANEADTLEAAADDLYRIFCGEEARSLATCEGSASQSSFSSLSALAGRQLPALLTPKQAATLRDNPTLLTEQALLRMYGSGQWGSLLPLQEDPLGLADGYLEEMLANLMPHRLHHGMVVLADPSGREVAMALPLLLSGDAYNLDFQGRFRGWMAQQQSRFAAHHPGVRLLFSGVIFHASSAADHARSEITLISTLSLAGIVLLFLLSFRAWAPLLAGLFSLGFGCLAAILACAHFFGALHLITLVFGCSLLGVSIDYTLHFFCERDFNSGESNGKGRRALGRIFPSITMGLVTSLIGYGILTQAPMPGLKQVALFSLVGLAAAWLAVVALFPLLPARAGSPIPPWLLAASSFSSHFWEQRGARASLSLAGMLLAFSVVAIAFFVTESASIRTLYKPDEALLAQEEEIRALFPDMAASQYFLVEGGSSDELLGREARLMAQLDALVASGDLGGYMAVGQWMGDASRQQANRKLLVATAYAEGGPADLFLQQVGADSAWLPALRGKYSAETAPLALEELHPLLPGPVQALYLGEVDGRQVSLVMLRGIRSLPALEGLALEEGVRFHDRIAVISRVLSAQQGKALQQLALGYLLIALLVVVRYRSLRALLLVAVPLLSTALTVAILSLAGLPLTLFHAFAFFLILGLGMDYAIFLFDAGDAAESARVAVLLSAITTWLSFGLLGLSSTPMVADFGITLLLGTLFSYLLAPLVRIGRRSGA